MLYFKRQILRRLKDKEEKLEIKVVLKTFLFADFTNDLYQEAVRRALLGHGRTLSTCVNAGAIICSFHFFKLSFCRLIHAP